MFSNINSNLLRGNLVREIFIIIIIINIFALLDDKFSDNKEICSWKENILLSFRIFNLFSFDNLYIFILGILGILGGVYWLFYTDKSQRN